MLAKLTVKNQLTLPKSVTQSLGPVQYFEVQEKAGQIILTPVRIQRGDALRAKLAELEIDAKTIEGALSWAGKKMKLEVAPAKAGPQPARKRGSKTVEALSKAETAAPRQRNKAALKSAQPLPLKKPATRPPRSEKLSPVITEKRSKTRPSVQAEMRQRSAANLAKTAGTNAAEPGAKTRTAAAAKNVGQRAVRNKPARVSPQ